jgi:hypothetical protein
MSQDPELGPEVWLSEPWSTLAWLGVCLATPIVLGVICAAVRGC